MSKTSNMPPVKPKVFRVIILISSLLLLSASPASRAQAQTPAAKPDAAQTPARPSANKQTTTAKPTAEIPADAAAQANAVALRALPAKGKRYALIIGVDKYADTQITTLWRSKQRRALAG